MSEMSESEDTLLDKLEETIHILEGLIEVVKEQGQMIQILNGRILAETSPNYRSQQYSIDDAYDAYDAYEDYEDYEDDFQDSLDSPLQDPLGGIEEMMTEVHI